MIYWYCFCLFKMGFNNVMYSDFFILNWCLVLAVSKTEKQSLEHLSKQYWNDIRCWYMWDFLSLSKCLFILVVKYWQVWPIQLALQLELTNLYTTCEKVKVNTFPRLAISLFVLLAVILVVSVRIADVWQPK